MEIRHRSQGGWQACASGGITREVSAGIGEGETAVELLRDGFLGFVVWFCCLLFVLFLRRSVTIINTRCGWRKEVKEKV